MREKACLPARQGFILPLVLVILAVGVVAGVLGIFLFGKRLTRQRPTSTQTTAPELTQATLADKPRFLAFLKHELVEEIWIYDFISNKEFFVFPQIDQKSYCSDVCSVRSFSFSNDGKKLTADLVRKGDEDWFGYVDIFENNNQIHYLHRGYRPVWSPKDDFIIFRDRSRVNGWQLMSLNLKDNNVMKFNDLDVKNMEEYHYMFQDWISDYEILLLRYPEGRPRPLHAHSFYKGDILTGNMTKLNIPSGVEARVSPLKDKVLIEVSIGSSYDVIVSDMNGFIYRSITDFTGNSRASGYFIGAWSPDGKKVALKDWFTRNPLKPSGGTRDIKIFDLSGKLVKIIEAETEREFDQELSMCWVQTLEKEFIITPSDNGTSVFDLKGNEVKRIEEKGMVFPCS